MEILTHKELALRKNEILDKIKAGEIFIYPTDTIYGIGCIATNTKSIQKIREIKNRPNAPFSIIAPSLEWINENCPQNEWIDQLPGPLTLVMPCSFSFPDNLNPGKSTVGVRFPNHWITEFVKELGTAIVTTSANKHGKEFMTSTKDLDPDVEKEVDFMIYEGVKEARPSKIIHIDSKEIIER